MIDKWFIIETVEDGKLLVTYPNERKLRNYFIKKLKLTVLSIIEATKEDYNKYFNIKE